MRRFRGTIFVLASALLVSAPFHDPRWAPLAFVGLIPFFSALGAGRSSSDALKTSWLFGFFFFLAVLYPLAVLTVPGYAALSAALAVYPAIAGVCLRPWIDPSGELVDTSFRRSLKGAFFIPSIWVLSDWVRGWNGFPLGFLGHAQWKSLPVIQIADVTGVWGVTWLAVFTNAALFKLFKEAADGSRRPEDALSRGSRRRYVLQLSASAAAIWVVALSYGAWRLAEWNAFALREEKASLRVAVLQGNIPQDQKWDRRIKDLIFEKYKRLTFMGAVERSDLIVWPETSFPGFLEDEPLMSAKLRTLVRQSHTDVLVGAPTVGEPAANGVKFFNSAIQLGPDGEERRRYHKLRLVPFGEYVPFEAFIGWVRRLGPPIGDFSPGNEWTVFDLESHYQPRKVYAKFSTLICYEDMFPGLTRGFVERGANFLVVITNDAWFKETTAPYLHGQASVFRAVENRVPVVRAANTGWSSFIDQTGAVLSAVQDKGKEIGVTGHQSQEIALRRVTSFYTRFGDVFVLILAGLGVLAYLDNSRHNAYSRV